MGISVLSASHIVNAQGLWLLTFTVTYARAVVLKCCFTDHLLASDTSGVCFSHTAFSSLPWIPESKYDFNVISQTWCHEGDETFLIFWSRMGNTAQLPWALGLWTHFWHPRRYSWVCGPAFLGVTSIYWVANIVPGGRREESWEAEVDMSRLRLDKGVESWSGPIILEPDIRTLKIICNTKQLCSAHSLSPVGKHHVDSCSWLQMNR